jgi:DedD protein
MEQQLKERIVGAIVLVALGMLVIPALLDGPDPSADTVGVVLSDQDEGTKTHRIRLDVQEKAPATPSSGRISRAQPEPVTMPASTAKESAAEAPGVGEREPRAESPAEPPARPNVSTPEPAPAPVAQTATPTGSWAVQVGSFSQKQNADRLARELSERGFDVSVSAVKGSGGTMHRVRVGPVEDRDSAEALRARLEASGQQGRVVRSDG